MSRGRRTYLLAGILVLTLFVTVVPSISNPEVIVVERDVYTQADFVSKNILFDESHTQNGSAVWAPGNASMFSWLLGEHGYTSYTNFDQSLDSGILSGFDILVIFFPQKALTVGEISAIETFVDGGGGLLLVGVNYGNTWGFTRSHLNALSSSFGIIFNDDIVLDATSTFADHNVTYGLTSWSPYLDQMHGCSLSVTGSAVSVITSADKNLTAVAEYGLGRVVFVGSGGPLTFYRYESYTHGDSHMQFSLNVIDWLAGNPKRTVVVPEIARITVGTGPSLSPAEVEEYTLFVGQYHDHTTHSDGQSTPEDMLDSGLIRAMDFMIMTDHAHRNPTPIEGVTGGQAMRAIVDDHNLDIHITVGAELSSILHTTGFPLTENIWTNDQQTGIDEIHAQGGIATLSHPGISPNYATVFEEFESYGFDAIEVVNSNYFRGEGELGLLYNFMGANDHHAAYYVGGTETAVFVLNPSGPNGQISDADIVDAVLNRRIVILETYSSMVYGEEIWVDRYLQILSDAKAAVAAAHVTVQAVKDAGNSISLSEQYMDSADLALQYWNPARALNLAANATSSLALGLDYGITAPDSLQPDMDFDLTVQFTNNHSYPVSFDAVVFRDFSVTFGSSVYIVEASAEDASTTIIDGHTDPHGVGLYNLYLTDFNTSEYLMPVMFRGRNVIDNVTYVFEEIEGMYDIDVSFYVGRTASAFLRDVTLFYNDGSGEDSVLMVKGWNTYDVSLESYAPGSSITFYVSVETIYGDIFELSEQLINLPGGPTTTTTPTTGPTTGPGQPIDPMLLVAVGGIGVVVIVIVLIVVRKRGT
ncbi:MAG: hypothetical protein ACFFCX_09530 [Candidatus Sifarchaeia archaeon]